MRQFFSEGLAAGEIADALAFADGERPNISILSDEFRDSIERKGEHPNIQMRLLEKLLKGEIRAPAGEPIRRRPSSPATASRRCFVATSCARSPAQK